jgi:hypothetical protein
MIYDIHPLAIIIHQQQEVLERTNSPTFNRIYCSKQLGCHGYNGTHNPNQQFSKAHLTNLNLNNFKIIEPMRLKIIASRSP